MTGTAAECFERAQRLDRAGQYGEAAVAYDAYLTLCPADAPVWADYGGLLMLLGRIDEAVSACQRALALQPGLTAAQINLSCIRIGQGSWAEAEQRLRQVLAAEPERNDARLALTECLMKRGDLIPSRLEAERLLAQEPGNLEAHQMLCRTLVQSGERAAACAEVQRRYRHLGTSGCPEEAWELSNMNLLFGIMPLGWEQYEGRLAMPANSLPQSHPDHPRWQGEPLAGRTLLVDFEQGLGDTLMFARYAALLKGKGGRVIWSVQRELVDLLATCPGIEEIVPWGDPLPAFDLHVPLLSLPWVFRSELASIPAEIPYLRVPARVPGRQELLGSLAPGAGKVRIALAWAGSRIHKRDAERSLPVELLAPLAALPEVAWYSFHFGPAEAPFPGVTALAPLLSSFTDTAFALSAMDLVITVDTALAHLAGAMGVPALVLLHAFPDWRWLLERSDSPWYPTLRLYRQPSAGAWAPVIQQVLADLTSES